MLPTPTTRCAPMIASLTGARTPRSASNSQRPSKASDSGSMPSRASSGCACGAPSCHSTSPKRRGSRSRSAVSPNNRSTWSCAPGGAAGSTTRRLPDMPRCTITLPASKRSSRYLARRSTASSGRPAMQPARSSGTGWRSRGLRTTQPLATRPVRTGAMPRRVVSTSGSSGMGSLSRKWPSCLPARPETAYHRTLHEPAQTGQLDPIMKHKLFPLVAGTALLLALAGPAAHAAPEGSPSSSADVPPLPAQELSADVLFLILLGEIAGNRGDLPVSAEAYLHAARQTLDPRIARRATEIALVARDMDTAAAAARIWLDTEPNSEEARRMLAGILSARGEQM